MSTTLQRFALAASISMFTLQACVAPPTAGNYSAVDSYRRLINTDNSFTRSLAAKPASYVGGYVIFGAPVEGATVSLLDTDGKPLDITGKTGQYGIFGIHGKMPPKDFTIVATGGTVNGEPFTGELRQDVKAHSQLNEFAHLSVATTLASLYRQKAPGVDPVVAEADAYRFLGLSTVMNPLQFDRHFDAPAFSRAANAAGGVSAFTRALAPEIPDPSKIRRFASFQTKQITVSGMTATSLATDLGKGALSSVGGMLLGQAMTLIGIGDSAKLGQLKKELDAISAQLTDIQTDLVNLQKALNLDTKDSNYQAAVRAIGAVASAVDNAQQAQSRMIAYKTNSTLSPSDVTNSIAKQQVLFDAAFQAINSGGLPFWRSQILPSADGATGLFTAYGQLVTAKSPLWGPKQAALMDAYFDWFDANQAAAALVMTSNSDGAPSFVKSTYDDLQNNRAAEVAIMRGNQRKSLSLVTPGTSGVPARDVAFPSYLPDGMICDTNKNTLWWTGRGGNPAAFLFNQVIGVPADPNWTAVQQSQYDQRDLFGCVNELAINRSQYDWTWPGGDELVAMFSNRQALSDAGWTNASLVDGVTTYPLIQDDLRIMAFDNNRINSARDYSTLWRVPYVGGTISKVITMAQKYVVPDPKSSYWYP